MYSNPGPSQQYGKRSSTVFLPKIQPSGPWSPRLTGSQHGCISPYARLKSRDAPGFRLTSAEQEAELGIDLASAIWVSGGERAMRDGSKATSRDWGCARRSAFWVWELRWASSGRSSGAGMSEVEACWVDKSPRAGKSKSVLNCGYAATGMRRWEMVPM